MLSLKQALQLPILQDARVVAGVTGLDCQIRWVHNVSEHNAADWLHGGELVLTTVRTCRIHRKRAASTCGNWRTKASLPW